MFGLLINIILLILWVSLLYLFNKNLEAILLGVAVGIVSVGLLSILVESYIMETAGVTTAMQQSMIVVAPVVEESLKFLSIFLAAWKSHKVLSEVRIFGAATGLGFAYFENLGVITNVQNILLRSFTSWPLHVITALVLSYAVKSRLTLRRNIASTVVYFLTATIIHAGFNYVVLFWI